MNSTAEFKAYKAGRKFVNLLAGIIVLPFALAFIAIFAALWFIFAALWFGVTFLLWLIGHEIEFKRGGQIFATLKWFKFMRY